MNIVLTGSTGFLGAEFLRKFLLDPAVRRVHLLVRPAFGLGPEQRIARLHSHWQKHVETPSARQMEKIRYYSCDISESLPPKIDGPVDYYFHCAASTELGMKLSTGRRHNLRATQLVLEHAAGCRGLRRFIHFSTAFVAGHTAGLIRESERPAGDFCNHYERTKWESEQAVRASGLPFVILRPSVIVGRSDNGYMNGTKVLYSVWRMWQAGVMPRAPLDPKSWVDIVPVDFVVNASVFLGMLPESQGRTLHLCSGEDRQSPETIMNTVIRVFNAARPPLSPPWVAKFLMLPVVRPFLKSSLAEMLDVMGNHLPYLGFRDRIFDMSQTNRLLGQELTCPRFDRYGEVLFRYCRDTSWGRKPLKKIIENADKGELECSA